MNSNNYSITTYSISCNIDSYYSVITITVYQTYPYGSSHNNEQSLRFVNCLIRTKRELPRPPTSKGNCMKLQAKAIVSSKENPQTICFFLKKKKKKLVSQLINHKKNPLLLLNPIMQNHKFIKLIAKRFDTHEQYEFIDQ